MNPLEGKSVLDSGCGLGDFYGHLQERGIKCDYFGLDLSPEMVKRARAKYPGGRFDVADMFAFPDEPQFDYSVAFGIHNVKIAGGLELLQKMGKKQLSISRTAGHISILSDRFEGGFGDDIEAYNAEKMLSWALSVTPWVTLRHDYLPHDFSLSLYNRARFDEER